MVNILRSLSRPLRTVAVLKRLVPDFTGMASRNGGRPLIDWLLLAGRCVVGSLNRSTIGVSAIFAFRVGQLMKAQGAPGTVKYLKASHVLLMQASAGMRLDGTWALGANVSRTLSGYPRIVCASSRAAIKGGDARVLKLWLTLLSLYRVIEFPGVMKLDTIILPGIPIGHLLLEAGTFALTFFHHFPNGKKWSKVALELRSAIRLNQLRDLRVPVLKASPFEIQKATPIRLKEQRAVGNVLYNSTSLPSLVLASVEWSKRPALKAVLWEMCVLTGTYELPIFMSLLEASFAESGFPTETWQREYSDLGKLAVKSEPAGKERVFAIVDAFTQWVMKPLHDLLFEMLRGIPQDGTFDQGKPLRALLDRHTKTENPFIASLDLSAATDRLPISLQKLLLSVLLGERFSELWKSLMVDRDYAVPNSVRTVRYAVGQPMGALSSWAMLALTHHFIIQWAHWRVSARNELPYTWCSDYAVLGDDVVIVGRELADEYQLIMRDLGVGIGLHKSVLATTLSAEFAKRFVWLGVDCSPISFSELAVARRSLGSALELRRRHGVSNSAFYRVLGVGPFALTRMEQPRSARIEAYKVMLGWPVDGPSYKITYSLRPYPVRELSGFARFSYLHVLAHSLCTSLVDAYRGLAVRLDSLPPSRVKLLEDRWFASSMENNDIVAAVNLNDDYSMCFSPMGGYNEAVARMEELEPEITKFVEDASTIGLWDVASLYSNYLSVARKVASVRVPTNDEDVRVVLDSQVTDETVPLALRFVLRYQAAVKFVQRTGVCYGVKDYPGSARRDARFLVPWDARDND